MTEPKLGHLLGAVLRDLHSPLGAAVLHLARIDWPLEMDSSPAAGAVAAALRALRRAERLCHDGERLAGLLQGAPVRLHLQDCSLQAALHAIGSEEPALVQRLDGTALPHDVLLRADPLCLYRVLTNLLGYARKHGGPRVCVTASAMKLRAIDGLPACPLGLRYARAALLTISDDGPGLAYQARAGLFRPLWRDEQDPARPGGGLGLWLARELVRAHGGDLWLDPGVGTRLCSLWPLAGESPRLTRPPRGRSLCRLRFLPATPVELPPGTTLAEAERIVIQEALHQSGGNKDAAALRLGMSRRTLYSKLSRFDQ